MHRLKFIIQTQFFDGFEKLALHTNGQIDTTGTYQSISISLKQVRTEYLSIGESININISLNKFRIEHLSIIININISLKV
jgi:hypothetical protein